MCTFKYGLLPPSSEVETVLLNRFALSIVNAYAYCLPDRCSVFSALFIFFKAHDCCLLVLYRTNKDFKIEIASTVTCNSWHDPFFSPDQFPLKNDLSRTHDLNLAEDKYMASTCTPTVHTDTHYALSNM